MKIVYESDEEYTDLPYALYESGFVPLVMTQLRLNNLHELNKIFDFIETLLLHGDEMVVNLVAVAVVESLVFEDEYDKFKDIILNMCGERTRKSFNECIE